MNTLDVATLNLTNTLTNHCRVKRHLITTSTQTHGRPAETKPDTAIHTHHPNTRPANKTQGPKLYLKVLTIEPNHLLSKCSELNKGTGLRLCLSVVPLLDCQTVVNFQII